MTLSRVEQLFALACSSTHEEEARTAAITGVRLMRRLGLRVTGGPTVVAYARVPTPADLVIKPPDGGVWVDVTRERRCDCCGDRIEAWTRAYVDMDGEYWCGRH